MADALTPHEEAVMSNTLYGSGARPLLQFDLLDAVPDQRCGCGLQLSEERVTAAQGQPGAGLLSGR